MARSDLYSFTIQTLTSLLTTYGPGGPKEHLDSKSCQGIVFTPGPGADAQKIFSFPLYGDPLAGNKRVVPNEHPLYINEDR